MLLNNTISKVSRKKSQTFDEDIDMDVTASKVITSSDISNDNSLESNNSLSDNSSEKDFNNEKYNLIYDILVKIDNDTNNNDKFTQFNINEAIEKKSDEEKEQNLKFIETLNKESRQSLKTMISLGIDKWKDLSKKTNKHLYFDEPEELYNISEDLSLSTNEIEDENRNIAITQLGENYTHEEYAEWLETRNANLQEDSMVMEEADYLADDDGDEHADEDFDGEL